MLRVTRPRLLMTTALLVPFYVLPSLAIVLMQTLSDAAALGASVAVAVLGALCSGFVINRYLVGGLIYGCALLAGAGLYVAGASAAHAALTAGLLPGMITGWFAQQLYCNLGD